MRFVLAAVAALLLAAPTWAVDGEFIRSYASGSWMVAEYFLCDGDHNAPSDCTEFDLHTGAVTGGVSPTTTVPNAYPGLPQHLVVSIQQDDCETTANDVQIQLNSRSGITGTAAASPGAHLLGVLSWDGGSSGVASLTSSPLTHRFVRGEVIVGGTGVCSNFEVVLRLFYPRLSAP